MLPTLPSFRLPEGYTQRPLAGPVGSLKEMWSPGTICV